MIYAQILNGKIENVIKLEDPALLPLFEEGFDKCVRVDNIDPRPGIGWSYADGIFIPPPTPEPEPEIEEEE